MGPLVVIITVDPQAFLPAACLCYLGSPFPIVLGSRTTSAPGPQRLRSKLFFF